MTAPILAAACERSASETGTLQAGQIGYDRKPPWTDLYDLASGSFGGWERAFAACRPHQIKLPDKANSTIYQATHPPCASR